MKEGIFSPQVFYFFFLYWTSKKKKPAKSTTSLYDNKLRRQSNRKTAGLVNTKPRSQFESVPEVQAHCLCMTIGWRIITIHGKKSWWDVMNVASDIRLYQKSQRNNNSWTYCKELLSGRAHLCTLQSHSTCDRVQDRSCCLPSMVLC